jgi:hypothetical protein
MSLLVLGHRCQAGDGILRRLLKMTRYAISPDAACAVVEDGAVVLNLRTKRYYSLNETGAAIWELLEAGTSPDAIPARLTERFAVDDAVAATAVARLLDDLTAEALISAESS